MIIAATITKRSRENVEVDEKTVVRQIISAYQKKFNADFCIYDSYLTRECDLKEYVGDNHHNGNPEYEVKRKATAEDINHLEWVSRLRECML